MNMKKLTILLLIFNALLVSKECLGQKSNADKKYTFKKGYDNGIGKWYMGK